MKVQVRQTHIENGIRADDRYCPIALALKDAGYTNPIVFPIFGEVQISWECGGSWIFTSCWVTDHEVYLKATRYDETGEMEEFEFEMPLAPNGKIPV